jgi:hypothetical protein
LKKKEKASSYGVPASYYLARPLALIQFIQKLRKKCFGILTYLKTEISKEI